MIAGKPSVDAETEALNLLIVSPACSFETIIILSFPNPPTVTPLLLGRLTGGELRAEVGLEILRGCNRDGIELGEIDIDPPLPPPP
jgi:hypothetical protein